MRWLFYLIFLGILFMWIIRFRVLGPSFYLISSFLSESVQFVKYSVFCSGRKPIFICVPQGTILAPAVVLIYYIIDRSAIDL